LRVAFRFSYRRLDAFHVAKDALARGHRIAKKFPRGYGAIGDQLRRALASAYTQTIEGTSREGADRRQRCRVAGIVSETEANEVLSLLDRLAGMLTRLGGLGA
jgi:hypothetical protein